MSSLTTEMFVQCASWQQAQDIADHLFERNLVAGTEIFPVQTETAGVKLIIAHLEEDAAAIRQELHAFFASSATIPGTLEF